MLDLEQIILVGLLVQDELGGVFVSLFACALEFEREPGGRFAIACLEIILDRGFEPIDMSFVAGHLAAHTLDKRPILLQANSTLSELDHGVVVLSLHEGDRIGLPEEIRQLVDLRLQQVPQRVEDHACACLCSSMVGQLKSHQPAGAAGAAATAAGAEPGTGTRFTRTQPVGSSGEIDWMAKPRSFRLSRLASMGCERSRAASALRTAHR